MEFQPLRIKSDGTPDYYLRITQAFSFSNHRILFWAAVIFACGYVQYVYNTLLLRREKASPFPLWMHTFYLAHDGTWAIKLFLAAPRYNWHWFLVSTSGALVVWTFLEIYSLFKAVTDERTEVFGPLFPRSKQVTISQALGYLAYQQVVMFVVLQAGIVVMGPDCVLQWFCLTNLVMAVGTTELIMARGSRKGSSVVLLLSTVVGTAGTFSPASIFVQILPEVFDRVEYYTVGVFLVLLTLRNVFLLLSYPPKTPTVAVPNPIW